MLHTRIWSPDPLWNRDVKWFENLGREVVYSGPLERYPVRLANRYTNGFRLSLFWSLYISVDALLEVEVEDEILNSGFWSPTDKNWRSSHLFGFRVVSKIKPTKLLGCITENTIQETFKQLEVLHVNMLKGTKLFQHLSAAFELTSLTSCTAAVETIERYKFALEPWSAYETAQRCDIVVQRLTTARQYNQYDWIVNRKTQRCYKHLMGAFMRPLIHNFLEVYRWANEEKVSLPSTDGSKVNPDVIKQYRTDVNNIVLAALET